MSKEQLIARGYGRLGVDDPRVDRDVDQFFREWQERDSKRPRKAGRVSRLLCRVLGHAVFDASSEWQPFGYSSTSLVNGERSTHEGARQRSAWIYCKRCGEVLRSGVEFDGFVIPGQSSVP